MSKEIDELNLELSTDTETKTVKIPISEQVKAWRKVNGDKELKLEDLKTFLMEIFFGDKSKRARDWEYDSPVHYIREDGTEMVKWMGPHIYGGAMEASKWNQMLLNEASSFITTSSNFVKNE